MPGAEGRARLTGVPRLIVLGSWFAGAVILVVVRGVPLDRAQVLAWIVGTLALITALAGGRLQQVLADWLPLAALLLAYDLTRGAVDTLGMPVQVRSMASVESALFGGHVPTVWLQERVYRNNPKIAAWWEVPISVVYVSHFVTVYALGAWYWTRGREQWRFWLHRFGGVTAVGLVFFVLLPAAPPWMASQLGVIGPVQRTAPRGLSVVGLDIAERLVDTGQTGVNLVAAMPSLHAAHAALVPALLWAGRTLVVRLCLLAYPLAMGVVLVLTGEHYVIDVLAGFALVLVVCRIARRWESRSAPPGERTAPLPPPPTAGVTTARQPGQSAGTPTEGTPGRAGTAGRAGSVATSAASGMAGTAGSAGTVAVTPSVSWVTWPGSRAATSAGTRPLAPEPPRLLITSRAGRHSVACCSSSSRESPIVVGGSFPGFGIG